MSWTEERINDLTQMWQAGHSASDIGKHLGVSKNAVVGKAHRLKLPSRPSPIKQQDEDGDGEAMQADGEGAAHAANGADANGAGAKGGGANGTAASNGASGTNGGGRSKRSGSGKRSGGRSKQPKAQPPQRAQIEARGHRTGCLWPFGDPSEPDFHFCGADSLPGKPYCAEHAARAYITKSRERDEETA